MVNTKVDSYKNIQLKDRLLWADGASSFPASAILPVIQTGMKTDGMFVEELTKDIKQFNSLVDPKRQITIKTDVADPDFNWNIPKEAKELKLIDYLVDKVDKECEGMTDDDTEIRYCRLCEEVSLYKKHGLLDVLRVIIYVINTLSNKGVVWGVGRGSSVSSYVLYLIGVHDVDSITYNLDIEDFLR